MNATGREREGERVGREKERQWLLESGKPLTFNKDTEIVGGRQDPVTGLDSGKGSGGVGVSPQHL